MIKLNSKDEKNMDWISVTNLLIIIVFMNLPPMYIVGIRSAFFTSHSIAKYLILFNFICLTAINLVRGRGLPLQKSFALVLLGLFVMQSISIANAINVEMYLSFYKDIVMSMILFITILLIPIRKNVNRIISSILVAGAVNVLIEFFIYFFPSVIFTYLQPLIYDKVWESFVVQYNRQRYFSNFLVEVFISFIIYRLMSEKKSASKVLYSIYFGMVSFFAYVSNWRTKLLVLFFSVIVSSLTFVKKVIVFIILLFSLFSILVLSDKISLNTIGTNTLDRIINFDVVRSESKDAVLSRFSYWKEAYEISLSSPLVGIGLGNYFDHSQIMKTGSIFIDNPHNYFMSVLVDTGFIGLLFFCLLILYFIYFDIQSLRSNQSLQQVFVIAFWSLFIFSLLNPQDFFYYYFLFWLFRGIIYKMQME